MDPEPLAIYEMHVTLDLQHVLVVKEMIYMLVQRACRSAQGVRSRILVSFVIVLALFSTAGVAQAFPLASKNRDSSSSCGDDTDVVSVERMDRAALEQASTVMWFVR